MTTTTTRRYVLPNSAEIVSAELGFQDLKLSPSGEAAAAAIRLEFDGGARKVRVLDDAGNPIVAVENGVTRELELHEHLKALAKSNPTLFEASVSSTTTVNPFAKATWNLSRQSMLTRSDPAAAKRMKAEAAQAEGRSNPWTKAGFNLTTQMKLTRENPTLAAQLRMEAGR